MVKYDIQGYLAHILPMPRGPVGLWLSCLILHESLSVRGSKLEIEIIFTWILMSARREKVESIKVIKVTKVLQWELGLLSVVLVIPNRQKKDPCLGPGSESHIAGFTRTTALHYIGNFRLRKPPPPRQNPGFAPVHYWKSPIRLPCISGM